MKKLYKKTYKNAQLKIINLSSHDIITESICTSGYHCEVHEEVQNCFQHTPDESNTDYNV